MRRTALIPLLLLSTAALAAGAASAAAPTEAGDQRAPQLTADRDAVQPGATVTLQGRGFPHNVHVSLLAGPPNGATTRIGGARTGQRGGFVATIHVRQRADAGALVALACLDACRVKASARFRIVAP